MNKLLSGLVATTSLFLAAQPAAAQIAWTDWTAQTTTSPGAVGTVSGVGVTYSGALWFLNATPNTNYYVGTAFPAAFTPTNTELVGLNEAGKKSITFSSPVTDIYLALVSWNGQNNVSFSSPFTTVSPISACGYWGCGVLPASGSSFTSGGEIHGVLKFTGTFSSLQFSDSNNENWHGFTVGIGSVATGAVPEPATWLTMIMGFAILGGAMRRRTPAVRVRYS